MSSKPSPVIDAAARFSRRSQVALTESLLGDARTPHNGGDGGSGGSGMEKRIDRLESGLDAIRKDTADIRVILARIEADLSHKIDYKWMSVYVIAIAMLMLREEIIAMFR